MSKKKKKTFILTVKLIGHKDGKLGGNVPDFGMGKGVILRQEMEFTDSRGRGFNTPIFEYTKIQHQDRTVAKLLEFEWTEKRPKPKRKKVRQFTPEARAFKPPRN